MSTLVVTLPGLRPVREQFKRDLDCVIQLAEFVLKHTRCTDLAKELKHDGGQPQPPIANLEQVVKDVNVALRNTRMPLFQAGNKVSHVFEGFHTMLHLLKSCQQGIIRNKGQ